MSISNGVNLVNTERGKRNTHEEIKVNNPEPVDSTPRTDTEWVQYLLDSGYTVIDGGCNKTPEFNLTSIHEFPDLVHSGFGYFHNDEFNFNRFDSPNGTRYYVKEKRDR